MMKRPWLKGNWHSISIQPVESNELCRFCQHGEYWHRQPVRSLRPCVYGDGAVRSSSPGEVNILVPGEISYMCSCLDFVPTENLKYLEHTMKRRKE